MAGKKKSLASRLAKMSDEERARYLQMKADQEEEARRRKEQLVTAFMKNKIKREETFGRLNKAKINLQWHQFMRLRKCKDMKEDCEYTRRYIERVIAIKNRTIENLMKELDEAEFQYSVNLQAHLQHVDNFTEFHRKYAEQIRGEYENDLESLLDEAFNERELFKRTARTDIKHLKTLVYGQQVVGGASVKENRNYYLKLKAQYVKECNEEFRILRRKSYEMSGAIWRDIAALLHDYVDKTDKRRAQLADMRRLDAESATEIGRNQERIELQEVLIDKLQHEQISLKETRKNIVKSLKSTLKIVNEQFLEAKQSLQSELTTDDKKLRILTDVSRRIIENLENMVTKGEHLLQLAQSCRRLETEREKILKFSDSAILDEDYSSISEESEKDKKEDVEEVFMKVKMESIESKGDDQDIRTASTSSLTETDTSRTLQTNKNYKILIRHKYRSKVKKVEKIRMGERLRKELDMIEASTSTSGCLKKKKIRSIEKIDADIDRSPSVDVPKSGIIEENIESLSKMDAVWLCYNKVKLSYGDLKREKVKLIEENQHLKDTIKGVLEEALLRYRPPSKAPNRVRYVYLQTA